MSRRTLLPVVALAAAVASGVPAAGRSPAGDGAEPDRSEAIEAQVREFFGSHSLPSLSVGVLLGDETVYAHALGLADRASGRAATPETLYEIGSVGKVLTATVLAILDRRGVVGISDPVTRWLPAFADVGRHSADDPPITLEHLATHTSGLPANPVNVDHLPRYQWRGYGTEQLYAGFAGIELHQPPGAGFGYSNLGMGLLGHAMSVATGRSYEALVEEALLRPLGMTDTAISLRPDLAARYSVGYDAEDSSQEVPHWEYGVLAGCGSHRSTMPDLLRFLRAHWESGAEANPIDERVRSELHRIRWRSPDGELLMALGWFAAPHEGVGTVLLHRGRTPGHGAVLGLIPERQAGVVLLTNRGGRETNRAMADLVESLLLHLVSTAEEPPGSG